MYDIIGDIHGYATLLKKLLLQLGYKKTQDGYTHPTRKAIFVGDFINRGPQIRKTLKIVRKMVENGNALAVLGNHELNALILNLKDKNGFPVIQSPRKGLLSVFKSQGEFANKAEEWQSYLKWMRTIPLFLEMDNLRIVHACWSGEAVKHLKENLPGGKLKRKDIKNLYKKPDDELTKNIWLLTKGVYFTLPKDIRIRNNKGISPQSFRTRWWENPQGKTFNHVSFESKYNLPEYTIPDQILPEFYLYDVTQPPLFFGHYCRQNGPILINSNLCCVDSCVANHKILTAYQWDGETTLSPEKIVKVKA